MPSFLEPVMPGAFPQVYAAEPAPPSPRQAAAPGPAPLPAPAPTPHGAPQPVRDAPTPAPAPSLSPFARLSVPVPTTPAAKLGVASFAVAGVCHGLQVGLPLLVGQTALAGGLGAAVMAATSWGAVLGVLAGLTASCVWALQTLVAAVRAWWQADATLTADPARDVREDRDARGGRDDTACLAAARAAAHAAHPAHAAPAAASHGEATEAAPGAVTSAAPARVVPTPARLAVAPAVRMAAPAPAPAPTPRGVRLEVIPEGEPDSWGSDDDAATSATTAQLRPISPAERFMELDDDEATTLVASSDGDVSDIRDADGDEGPDKGRARHRAHGADTAAALAAFAAGSLLPARQLLATLRQAVAGHVVRVLDKRAVTAERDALRTQLAELRAAQAADAVRLAAGATEESDAVEIWFDAPTGEEPAADALRQQLEGQLAINHLLREENELLQQQKLAYLDNTAQARGAAEALLQASRAALEESDTQATVLFAQARALADTCHAASDATARLQETLPGWTSTQG